MIVALVALVAALGGTAYAAGQINVDKLGEVPLAKRTTHTFWAVVHNTSPPEAGYAQTNISPANPNAVEVHTKDKTGTNQDSDFQLIVICP